MENLKQMQRDFSAYMMARDYTPEAQLSPDLARAMIVAGAVFAAAILIAAIIF